MTNISNPATSSLKIICERTALNPFKIISQHFQGEIQAKSPYLFQLPQHWPFLREAAALHPAPLLHLPPPPPHDNTPPPQLVEQQVACTISPGWPGQRWKKGMKIFFAKYCQWLFNSPCCSMSCSLLVFPLNFE